MPDTESITPPPDPAFDPALTPPTETRQRVDADPAPVEEPEPEVTLTREEENLFLQLMTVGRRSKTISVFDHRVAIQTLNVDDDLRVSLFTRDYRDTDGNGRAYQLATCAAGIRSIDGEPLYKALSSEITEDEAFARKVEKLRNYYPIVISQIYSEVIKLDAEFAELAVKLGKLPG